MLLSFIAQMVMSQQWVTFVTRPENVILTVDETRIVVRDGRARFLLVPGTHKYSAESPYFEPLADTFDLKDTAHCDILVVMQSAYSYIDVETHHSNADIYIDRRNIGRDNTVSCRITAGDHRLTVIDDTMCLFDGKIVLQGAEKKHVDITQLNATPFRWDPARWLIPLSAMTDDGLVSDTSALELAHASMAHDLAAVNVTSNVDNADILIDNRFVGTTPLVVTNLIVNRQYLITVRKQGYRTASRIVLVSADSLTEAYIIMKKH